MPIIRISVVVFFFLSCHTSAAFAQTVSLSDIQKGGQIPYGKAVTLTGSLTDLKYGAVPITSLLSVKDLTASFVGQTILATPGTISGNAFSVQLGSLPADTPINLVLNITGKIVSVKQQDIVEQLFGSDEFRRSIQGFFKTTEDQPPTVVSDEAARLLRNISDQNGVLTKTLQDQLPCVSVKEITTAAVAGYRANLPDFIDLNNRSTDLLSPGLDGLPQNASLAAAHAFATGVLDPKAPKPLTRSGTLLQDNEATIAKNAARLFNRAYEKVLASFASDVVAQLSEGVQDNIPSATTDLQKYAGFDVDAIYAPRINELRDFLMIHVYPWGPVQLDTSGLLPSNWKSRFSLALGVSLGDISANGNSRVKSDKAFVYVPRENPPNKGTCYDREHSER